MSEVDPETGNDWNENLKFFRRNWDFENTRPIYGLWIYVRGLTRLLLLARYRYAFPEGTINPDPGPGVGDILILILEIEI